MDSKNYTQEYSQPERHDNVAFNEAGDYPPPPRYGEYEESAPQSQQEPLTEQQESELLDQSLRWIPKRPTVGLRGSSPIKRPVVIPRIDASRKLQIPLPFLRAYSPDLRLCDVNEAEFLAFIDNLSVAQAAPAPLQALDIAGKAAGFVPYHWVQIAAVGVEVAAGVGTATIVKVRTGRFMQRVNQEYFAPRGLKASIVKNDDLAEKLGYDKNALQLAPFDISSPNHTIRDRRMKALEPYIAPLSFDVPPPTQQRTMLDKISAKQIEHKIRKKQQKAEKKHQKQYNAQVSVQNAQLRNNHLPPQVDSEFAYSSDSSLSSISSISSLDEDLEKWNSKIEKINSKADQDILKNPKKAAKLDYERHKDIQKLERKKEKLNRKGDSKSLKAGRKEEKIDNKLSKRARKSAEKGEKSMLKDEKKANKMQFILIENL